MDKISAGTPNEPDDHGGPGWLAVSGIACFFGRHWPLAALSPLRASHQTSACADCGIWMERSADGQWRASPRSSAVAVAHSCAMAVRNER